MSKTELKIHTWPDRILKKKCKKVERIDASIYDYLGQMYSLMKESQGVGLAANQAGLDIALVVVEIGDTSLKLVNPRIVKKQGKITFEEGCLSFPGLSLQVKRSKKIWISSLDENGDPLDIEAKEILAVILQHEIDHINGIVFTDRLPLWQRLRILPKLRGMGFSSRS